MKILVIGGTGFIGPYVVRILNDMGHDIALFNRGQSKSSIVPQVKKICGDRKAIESFNGEFKKFLPDVVLDMIPMRESDAKSVISTFKGKAGRIVAISSQDVYSAYGKLIGIETGPKDDTPLKETAPLRTKLYPYKNPDNKDESHWSFYYDKILVEKIYMECSPLPASVLRLPMVYGPFDKQHRLYEFIKTMDDNRPFIMIQMDYAGWCWTRSYVEDVAHAISLAILNDSANGKIYNVGEPDALKVNQWINLIGKVIKWNGKIIQVPKESLPEDMRINIDTQYDLVTDSSLIRNELGFKEQISRKDAIRKTIEWERNNPPQNLDKSRFDYAKEDKIIASLSYE